MKNIGTFLLAGAVAGVGVWFFNTPAGKKLVDQAVKAVSDALSTPLKTDFTNADEIPDKAFSRTDDTIKPALQM